MTPKLERERDEALARLADREDAFRASLVHEGEALARAEQLQAALDETVTCSVRELELLARAERAEAERDGIREACARHAMVFLANVGRSFGAEDVCRDMGEHLAKEMRGATVVVVDVGAIEQERDRLAAEVAVLQRQRDIYWKNGNLTDTIDRLAAALRVAEAERGDYRGGWHTALDRIGLAKVRLELWTDWISDLRAWGVRVRQGLPAQERDRVTTMLRLLMNEVASLSAALDEAKAALREEKP